MKAKHAPPVESNRNIYITVLIERNCKGRSEVEVEIYRRSLEARPDAELLLLVQVGRELQDA